MEAIQSSFIELTNMLLSFLPDSPFQAVIESIGSIPWLGYVNYFIPVSEMVAIGEAWLTAIVVFYAYQGIMRFVNMIE